MMRGVSLLDIRLAVALSEAGPQSKLGPSSERPVSARRARLAEDRCLTSAGRGSEGQRTGPEIVPVGAPVVDVAANGGCDGCVLAHVLGANEVRFCDGVGRVWCQADDAEEVDRRRGRRPEVGARLAECDAVVPGAGCPGDV